MTHKNRAARFALGMAGLLSMAACGVIPKASDLVLGYQSTGGGIRPAPYHPAPVAPPPPPPP
jgi:hypothetical protein